MSKENVYIVVSHKHTLKKGTRDQWETTELVEFVNQLRKKHIGLSSAIGDYVNRKMISGARYGFTEYSKFEEYIRSKYGKQMNELDTVYQDLRSAEPEQPAVITDDFGNVREKTVFDI